MSADVAVTHAGFATLEYLEEAYASERTVAQVFGTLSMSGTCEGGGYDGAWTRDGAEAGRLLCYSREGPAAIAWSEPGAILLGGVRASDGDPATAWQAWLGPGSDCAPRSSDHALIRLARPGW